jgi:hypothetical protein
MSERDKLFRTIRYILIILFSLGLIMYVFTMLGLLC